MLYAIIAAVFLLFLTVSVIGGIYMYRFAIVRDKKTPDWWTHPEKLEPPRTRRLSHTADSGSLRTPPSRTTESAATAYPLPAV